MSDLEANIVRIAEMVLPVIVSRSVGQVWKKEDAELLCREAFIIAEAFVEECNGRK